MGIPQRKLDPLIGDENSVEFQAIGSSEAEVFHVSRSRVRIDP